MKLIPMMASMLLLAAGPIAAQEGGAFEGALTSEGPLNFHYVVQQDNAEPIVVETTLNVGESDTLVVNDDLVLEVMAPDDFGVNYLTRTLLKTRFGMDQLVIHSTEQDLAADGQPRQNAYIVCDKQVALLSPIPETLPDCES